MLTPDAFAARLDALGPFEAAPLLAVGVSGGADSLGLTLLADAWARARGGRVVALTVDHGLRPEAAEEARQVGRWLAPLGIDHVILRHDGPRPKGDLQAAARALRYRLLLGWCRDNACLHLLLAHHRDDQAETLLLRLARGSGVSGLAGMAAVSYRAEARLLRPLLDVPRAALEATLRARGQDWLHDPSNDDPAFARVRLRRAGPLLAGLGLDAARLATTAGRLGRARRAIDSAVDALLAEAVEIDPRGWARLDPAPLRRAPEEVALRLLADVTSAIGGRAHPPREARVLRALERLGAPATMQGCRLVPDRDGRLLVVREARGLDVRHGLRAGDTVFWDGRFRVDLGPLAESLTVRALGRRGWSGIAEAVRADVPTVARTTLPALFDAQGLLSVPLLGYNRDQAPGPGDPGTVARMVFAPSRAAGTLGFRLARSRSRIM